MVRSARAFAAVVGVGVCLVIGAPPASAGWFSDWWNGRVVTTALDAVTSPGVPVALEAKVERDLGGYLRPDLRGERVRFTLGSFSGSGRTDRDGVAGVSVQSARAGMATFEAAADSNARRTSSATLYVIDRTTPVAVVDIDGTLSDQADWEVPFRGDVAPAFPGCVSLLHELARTHAIVYLTARDDALDAVTRAFLARHGFPAGPVLYNDWGLTSKGELAQLRSKNHGDFKLEALRELMARGLNLRLGIGNAETDAYAYEQAGLPSFIQTTEVGAGPSFRFTDYATLRLELIARGILP